MRCGPERVSASETGVYSDLSGESIVASGACRARFEPSGAVEEWVVGELFTLLPLERLVRLVDRFRVMLAVPKPVTFTFKTVLGVDYRLDVWLPEEDSLAKAGWETAPVLCYYHGEAC